MKLPTALAALARHRLVGEAAWVFAGQALSALGTLAGVRLFTEFVPPAVFGTVALAIGIVALAQGLSAGALMQGVLRLYPECVANGTAAALRRASFSALRLPVLLSMAALLIGLTAWTWRANESPWLGVLAASLLVVEVARSVEITHLNAARRQRAMAMLVVADAWIRPALAVLAVKVAGPSANSVISGYFAGTGLTLLAFYLCRAPVSAVDEASETRSLQTRLWNYAKPLVPLPLIGWISGQADRYLLAAFAGLPSAGIYAGIYGLASKPYLMLGAWAELVLRPVYYGHMNAGSPADERRSIRIWLGLVAVPAVVLTGLIGRFHRQLASWLLAADYRSQSHLMFWIAVGYVVLIVSQVVERICYALHDTRGVTLVQTAGAAVSIVVAAPMIQSFGIQGAAWSVPIYFGLQMLMTIARARRALARRKQITERAREASLLEV